MPPPGPNELIAVLIHPAQRSRLPLAGASRSIPNSTAQSMRYRPGDTPLRAAAFPLLGRDWACPEGFYSSKWMPACQLCGS